MNSAEREATESNRRYVESWGQRRKKELQDFAEKHKVPAEVIDHIVHPGTVKTEELRNVLEKKKSVFSLANQFFRDLLGIVGWVLIVLTVVGIVALGWFLQNVRFVWNM